VSTIRATYRVQLHADFTFDDVASIAPYLAKLGVSHLYCSPYLQAHPGSTHGYDVADHTRFNEELGGDAAFEHMVSALAENGLSHIVDIVPNHVSIAGRGNSQWWDVLKNGRGSRFSEWFDIDWSPGQADLKNKVLVPILGSDLGDAIDAGEIKLSEENGEWVVRYYENVVPMAPETMPDDPASFSGDPSLLEDLLGRQHYVLAHWKRAQRHLNYRRFFDINTLAALQIDQPGVFEKTHGVVLKLIADGQLDGLRVDHIDGLRDPAAYLDRLSDETGAYLVVEKILEPGEKLPNMWPVEGTTGYDFLNVVGALFVDPENEEAMHDIYERFIGEQVSLKKMTLEKKYLIQRQIMVSDISRLVAGLSEVFANEGWTAEVDDADDYLRAALGEIIASFHVYRTYLSPDGKMPPEDRQQIRSAVAEAATRGRHIPAELFAKIEQVLLGESGGEQGRDLALRFQQTTGPIMAKSVEDTVFYNFNRLVSLNEVGGDPGNFGINLERFHAAASVAQEEWPLSMLASSTHDTKRSEDVRTRIDLLSEMPQEWAIAVNRWSEMARAHRSDEWPDPNAEYLLWQTLVGAWPISAERTVAYMQKASKEAKRYTSWVKPSADYDAALEHFVRGVLGDAALTADIAAFVAPLVAPGRASSLAQTLIKLTYPGVPDTYQGTETWDLSLVDPDNRRPVDYSARRAVLDRSEKIAAADLWADADDGAPKMLVTQRALAARSQWPHAFGADATYLPLHVSGPETDRIVAYARGDEDGPCVAVVVPRLTRNLGAGWGATAVEIPSGAWKDALTGSEVLAGSNPVAELLGDFPVSLLLKERG